MLNFTVHLAAVSASACIASRYTSFKETANVASEIFAKARESHRLTCEKAEKETILSKPWRDDQAALARAQQRHYKSPEYRQLHSSYITSSGLGLYGGEAGFEYTPRQHVDPDRPHIQPYLNNTRLLENVTYTNYKHFRRELKIIDIDKLIRHARMVPPPINLLQILINVGVPLPDKTCAAILRYQRRLIWVGTTATERRKALTIAREIFEHMLVIQLPPTDVGAETFAEMLKCTALCQDWALGWEAVHCRALERMRINPKEFSLTSYYFDALLELTVSCERVLEGLKEFQRLIAVNLRPRKESLDSALTLLAIATLENEEMSGNCSSALRKQDVERTDNVGIEAVFFERLVHSKLSSRLTPIELVHNETNSSCQKVEKEGQGALNEDVLRGIVTHATEIWELYDFYERERDNASAVAYLQVLAAAGDTERVLSLYEQLHSKGCKLNETFFLWVFYALRNSRSSMRTYASYCSRMSQEGLQRTPQIDQMILFGLALHGEGEEVLHFLENFIFSGAGPTRFGVREPLTPEIILYSFLAFLRSPDTTENMLNCAKTLLRYLDNNHSVIDIKEVLYDLFFAICVRVPNSIGEAYAAVKCLTSEGSILSSRMLNNLLLANSESDSNCGGSRAITEDIVTLLKNTPGIVATKQTFIALEMAEQKHGSSDLIKNSWGTLLHEAVNVGRQARFEAGVLPDASKDDSVEMLQSTDLDNNQKRREFVKSLLDQILEDPAINVPEVPAAWLRRHFIPWRLDSKEVNLAKLGQYSGTGKWLAVQPIDSSGSNKPFNSWKAGEKNIT